MTTRFLSCLAAGGLATLITTSAAATFHFTQIEQVIGGVNGDTTVQAIQLRMRSSFQNQLQFGRLRAWDATGSNPVLLINFNAPVPIGATGARVLVTSSNFSGVLDSPLTPDFTLTSLIPESYLAAGSITFENNLGTLIYWRLSWGGASYTGPTTGATTNDADGEFGPPWPGPLPSTSTEALLFQGPANAPSTNNADDYALTGGDAVFTNNAGASATVVGQPCPWDCANNDGAVNVSDLLQLLAEWDTDNPPCDGGGVCDFDDNGCVEVADLLKFLAHFDPAGVGCP